MKKASFDSYDEYKNSQLQTHLKKLHLLWFCGLTARPLKLFSSELLQLDSPSIVCMGSRNGLEPRFFKEAGFSNSVGLDIAPTANVLPFMMHHDFHELRPTYVKPFDVLYSNSFDHAYDIDRFLIACRSFLNDESIMLFDYSPKDNLTNPTKGQADCLAIEIEELIHRIFIMTGFRLVLQVNADPALSKVWNHYKDLQHLFFASPCCAERALERAAAIDKSYFMVYKNDHTIHEYLHKLHKSTHEHLSFIQVGGWG
jgi:hypothetical protein